MRVVIEVQFPGGEWAKVRQEMDFRDDHRKERGEAQRTALSKVESQVAKMQNKYRKYGGIVSWEEIIHNPT